MKRKKQLNNFKKPDIKEFDVPQFYLNFVNLKLKKTVKEIMRQVEKDGYKITRWKTKEAKIFTSEKEWELKARIEGVYVK